MNSKKIIRTWAKGVGISFGTALKLVQLSDQLANLQVTQCNEKVDEALIDKLSDELTALAKRLGFSVIWPGPYPVFVEGEKHYSLPDCDISESYIKVKNPVVHKTYSVDMPDKNYCHLANGVWHSEDNLRENDNRITNSIKVSRIFCNLLRVISGFVEEIDDCDSYVNITVRINNLYLYKGGWTEMKLIKFLEGIANHLNKDGVMRSEKEPTFLADDLLYFGNFEVPKSIACG